MSDHEADYDELFLDALIALRAEVERERSNAVEVIAGWAKVKPTTVYAYLERRSRPGSIHIPALISRGSTEEGFTAFAETYSLSAKVRLAEHGAGTANGTLHDQKRDSDRLWVRIYDAADVKDGATIVACGSALHANADDVIAEGHRLLGRTHGAATPLAT